MKKRKVKFSHIHKQSIFETIYNKKNMHDWMFFNKELSSIEILQPTLENLLLMKEYNLIFHVKGFRSPTEFHIYNKLRYKYGVYTMMYATRCIGNEFTANVLNAFINNEQLPNSNEIKEEVEKNKLLVLNKKTEKILKERMFYKNLSDKYKIILKRKIVSLMKHKRVKILQLIL